MNDIRVSIVEDDLTTQQGLAMLINGTIGFQCLNYYSNCLSMLNHVVQHPCDVLLMDLGLPGMSGIDGIRRAKQLIPDMNILVLTIHEDDDNVLNALLAGASGYLIKTEHPARLLDAIRDVHLGGSPMSGRIARKVIQIVQRKHEFLTDDSFNLTEQEHDILKRLTMGATFDQIGRETFISTSTVKYHVRKIYQKLQSTSKADAIAKALRVGLIR